jgi:cytochrome P450
LTSRSVAMQPLRTAPHVAGMTDITRYDETYEILRSNVFTQMVEKENAYLRRDTLLHIDGREHFNRRRLEARLFSKDALKYYATHVLQPAIDRSLLDALNSGESVDLVKLMRRTLIEMAAAISGITGIDSPEAAEALGAEVKLLVNATTVDHATDDHEEIIRVAKEAQRRLVRDFYAESLARCLEIKQALADSSIRKEEVPRNLLMTLVLADSPPIEPDLVLRETILYLGAAISTTSHSVPHVVNHLDAWVAEHPEDEQLRTDVGFLQRATYESLRLHVPAPAIIRTASRDVTLDCTGRAIAEGDRVALLTGPANRDQRIFGLTAETFDPYRKVTPPVKPWGLSFGGGQHSCIGRQLVVGTSQLVDELDADETIVPGIAPQILRSLYGAGIQIDQGLAPRYTTATFLDIFDLFPVRFGGA